MLNTKIQVIRYSFLFLLLCTGAGSLAGMQVHVEPYDYMRDAQAAKCIALEGRAGGIAEAYQFLTYTSKVARVGNYTVGFIDYEMYEESELNEAYGYIAYLGVAQSTREQGVGRLLLAYAIQDILTHGYHRIELHVLRSNLPAIRLYESMGFVFAGPADLSDSTVTMVYEAPQQEELKPHDKLSWLYFFASQGE